MSSTNSNLPYMTNPYYCKFIRILLHCIYFLCFVFPYTRTAVDFNINKTKSHSHVKVSFPSWFILIHVKATLRVSFFSTIAFAFIGVGNFVMLKLKPPNNYPLWREKVLGLAKSQDLVGYLNDEMLSPFLFSTWMVLVIEK